MIHHGHYINEAGKKKVITVHIEEEEEDAKCSALCCGCKSAAMDSASETVWAEFSEIMSVHLSIGSLSISFKGTFHHFYTRGLVNLYGMFSNFQRWSLLGFWGGEQITDKITPVMSRRCHLAYLCKTRWSHTFNKRSAWDFKGVVSNNVKVVQRHCHIKQWRKPAFTQVQFSSTFNFFLWGCIMNHDHTTPTATFKVIFTIGTSR